MNFDTEYVQNLQFRIRYLRGRLVDLQSAETLAEARDQAYDALNTDTRLGVQHTTAVIEHVRKLQKLNEDYYE